VRIFQIGEDRGHEVPYFITKMIAKEKIETLVCEVLENEMFLVDVTVHAGNVIHIAVDSMKGLTIDQCVALSRQIESRLDRESEDFELEVSSPGVDQYFKVNRQFHKNVGRELEVITKENAEIRGKLTESGDDGITLETETREITQTGKKKQLVKKCTFLKYEDIKKAKVIISFK
jgi:ribosome maturation factor RimP